jgi:ABC-type transport system involved in cytochrome bd biosynthesis fused ATPase/permease subunit
VRQNLQLLARVVDGLADIVNRFVFPLAAIGVSIIVLTTAIANRNSPQGFGDNTDHVVIVFVATIIFSVVALIAGNVLHYRRKREHDRWIRRLMRDEDEPP